MKGSCCWAMRGTLLVQEPVGWVGAAQFEVWERDSLPIAVCEPASLGRRSAINALAQQGRPYKVVYNSSSLAGQIAAVESGLAVAALTQCSTPDRLQVLRLAQGLGLMEPMQAAVYRSKASQGSKAVDSLHRMLLQTLRPAGR
eukprot:Opistho-2@24973